MSSERRARADDEVQGSALSHWLTDTLRPPRPDPVEPAAVEPGAEETPLPARDLSAAAQVASVDEIAEAEAAEAPETGELEPAAVDPGGSGSHERAFEGEGNDPAERESEPPSANGMALAPHGLRREAPEPGSELDEPDPSLVFLARERSVRRTQRIAIAAVAVCLLLFCGAFLWLKRKAPEPQAEAAQPPVAAPPIIAASEPDPPAPANTESTEPEAAEEDTVPVMRSGLSAAFRAPAPGPSAAPVPGGPSTARYPDLPRDVLMQLESAATTEQQR